MVNPGFILFVYFYGSALFFSKSFPHARVAELVDALDLGSSGVSCRGSTPLSRTRAGVTVCLFEMKNNPLTKTSVNRPMDPEHPDAL